MVLRRYARDGGQDSAQKRCKGWRSGWYPKEMQEMEVKMMPRRDARDGD